MCAARRPHKQSRAAWFFIFFLLLLTMSPGLVLLIPAAKIKDPSFSFPPKAVPSFSEGDEELVHVEEDSHSSPMSGGGGEEQLSRLGSRPPCCERKCGRCAPSCRCARRQGSQCSNYEPVGWKCKSGAAVFDP